MSVDSIKEAIRQLSEPDRRELADWIEELDASVWDAEIERDFAPGGRAEGVLAKLNREIDQGKFTPLEDGLRHRRKSM